MKPDERQKVLHWIEESQKEFFAAIDGVNDEQWKWKPAPDRWSVGEIAEHIVLAEAWQFGSVRRAISLPVNPNWENQTKEASQEATAWLRKVSPVSPGLVQQTTGKTEFMERVIGPRLGRARALEFIIPRGGMTQARVRELFDSQRAEMVKFVKETEVDLEKHTLENPFPVFGMLNAYQWLIYAPLHTMRHGKQIAEVKATAGYPQ